MKKKVSDIIADFLVEHGVKDMFSVTGGGAMHLNDSFGHHPKLRVIYNHHEQACAIACEGYVRTSGNPCAICVTSGPGGTNAITGVMGSWLDSIPIFVFSGQVKYSTTIKSCPNLKLRQLGDQEFNIVDAVACMTKYAFMIVEPNEILYHLQKAWYLMQEGRPGPVWLDIPLNVQAAVVETDGLKEYFPDETDGLKYDKFSVKDRAELLDEIKKAKRPVIMAGTAIDNTGYVRQFRKFAERLNIPVVTTWNAHDIMPDAHPLYCGRPGIMGTRGGNFVVQDSDLLLVIGSQLSIRQVSYNWENFAKNAKVIYVNFDADEYKKPTIHVGKSYVCDLRELIDVCLEDENFYDDNHREWLKFAKELNARYPANKGNYPKKNGLINPYEFFDRFSRTVEDDTAIICANGSACVITFQAWCFKENQRLFHNSGCASMGYGLPAAIGAAVSKAYDKVICLEGDGSLQMNIQELATMHYNQLNIKMVYLNNSGYHSIRQTQSNIFKGRELCGIDAECGIEFPDMELIAKAYKIPYMKLDNPDDIENMAKRFFSEKGNVILEVMLDKTQYFEPKLSSKILPDGTMVSPSLEDMYPFLPEEELQRCIIKC